MGQLLLFCPNIIWTLLVEVTSANALGEVTTNLTLEILERVLGVKVQSANESVMVGKPVNLTISVTSGTDLHYLWKKVEEKVQLLLKATSSLSPIYTTFGYTLFFLTISNALGSSNDSTEQSSRTHFWGKFQHGRKHHEALFLEIRYLHKSVGYSSYSLWHDMGMAAAEWGRRDADLPCTKCLLQI